VVIVTLKQFMLFFLENYTVLVLPKTKERTARTKKTKNNILAIPMAEPAIFVNPSTAAMIATTKNPIAKFNMIPSLVNMFVLV
jgi:hypothetical protein